MIPLKKSTTIRRGIWRGLLMGTAVLLLSFLVVACENTGIGTDTTNLTNQLVQVAQAQAGEWPTYLSNNARSSYNSAKGLTGTSVSKLKQHWTYQAKHPISSQPVEANGLVYWGSWDGNEHATDLRGKEVWATNLGVTTHQQCSPPSVGVTSTATIATVTINGTKTPVVFVGGGDHTFYALDASKGTILWKTALSASYDAFIWSSPAFYNGSIYIGLASFGDCPDVQGQFFQLDASTGAIQHTFDVVPKDCAGGGVWGSAAIDEQKGTLYFATGEKSQCKKAEPYSYAVIELQASDLKLLGSWQVEASYQTNDGDFGSTPTLFEAPIKQVKHMMVGIASKNGTFYAFDRDALNKGPVWRATIAQWGPCGECGDGSLSPAAWDGTNLYVAGGSTRINDVPCPGSIRALDPANGNFLWQDCLSNGPVLGAVTLAPGMAVVGDGRELVVVATDSGKTLFSYKENGDQSFFYSAASISTGVLYVGNMNGNLYAFGI
jgi:outer membrane protein assembly factor BamB/predicted small secreted protein